MSTVAFIRQCLARGMDVEAALMAAEIHEAANADALSARREKDAARQRARRERLSHVTSRDGEGDHVMSRDTADTPPSRPLSPQTPLSPTHPPGVCSSRTRGAAFAAFWEAYPRKTGKGAAERAYAKALAKVSGPDPPAVLLGALERVKATWTDAQYIPHPATWLNQERWDDEPEPIFVPKRANERADRHPANSRAERRGVWAEIAAEERSQGAGEFAEP